MHSIKFDRIDSYIFRENKTKLLMYVFDKKKKGKKNKHSKQHSIIPASC